ncbi:MAG: glycosyltransferase family 2 protein, partial [Pseudomonadota bacterium]
MRVLVITTMRNEAPFILEWLAYHQHIGVTNFLVYSNDCDDGTDELLDRLAALGHLHHERNHSGGKKSVQWRALNKAKNHATTREADWIYVTDVDEFLCIHAGEGYIADLLAACPEADGFALPWRMFGNAGVETFVDAPILSQFT